MMKKILYKPFFVLLAIQIAATCGFGIQHAFAQTSYEYSGGGDGISWEDAANWQPNGVPGAGDNADIFSDTVSVSASILTLRTLSVRGSGIVQFGGNVITADSLSINATSGGLSGSGSLNIDKLSWSTGYVEGGAQLSVTGTSSISGISFSRYLKSSSLVVSGTLTLQGRMRVTDGSMINVMPGATFVLQDGADITYQTTVGSPAGVLNNSGTVRKLPSTNVSELTLELENLGVVESLGGRLQFNGGGSSSGDFIAALDSEISFQKTFQFPVAEYLFPGADFAGLGTMNFGGSPTDAQLTGSYNVGNTTVSGATITITNDVSLVSLGDSLRVSSGLLRLNRTPASMPRAVSLGSTLETNVDLQFTDLYLSSFNAVALAGTGNVTTTKLVWNSGVIESSGIVTVTGLSGSEINGVSFQRYLKGSTLRIEGNATLIGRMRVTDGSVISVAAGATFDLQNGADISYQTAVGSPVGVLSNSGTIRKLASANVSGLSLELENLGVVESLGGSLQFNGGGSSSGDFVAALDSEISFQKEAGFPVAEYLFPEADFAGLGTMNFGGTPVDALLTGSYNVGVTTVSGATITITNDASLVSLGDSLSVFTGLLRLNQTPDVMPRAASLRSTLETNVDLQFTDLYLSSFNAVALAGTGNVTTTKLVWSTGVIESNGIVTVTGPSGAEISGLSFVRYLKGSTLRLEGNSTLTGRMRVTDRSLIEVAEGSTFRLNDGADISYQTIPVADTARIHVEGVLSIEPGGSDLNLVVDNDGQLAFDGGPVSIGQNGRLLNNATGSLTANGQLNVTAAHEVINRGTFAVLGTDPGTLIFNGDFVNAPGTYTAIAKSGSARFLTVTGDATLGGSLVLVQDVGDEPALGERIPFLQANSISGQFDSISSQIPGKTARVVVEGNTASLEIIEGEIQVAGDQIRVGPSDPQLLWSQPISRGFRSAVVDGNLNVYVTTTLNDQVVAFDSVGAQKWLLDDPSLDLSNRMHLSPDESTLYLSGNPVRAITAETGVQTWTLNLVGSSTLLAVGPDGTIFANKFSTSNPQLVAINPDGTEKWRFSVGSSVSTAAIGATGPLYVEDNSDLVAVDANGEELWRKTYETSVLINRLVASDDGSVVVCDEDMVERVTAANIVQFQVVKPCVSISNMPDDGFLVDHGKVLAAYNNSGEMRWQRHQFDGFAGPVDSDGIAYVLEDSLVKAINIDGVERWAFDELYGVSAVGPRGTLVAIDGETDTINMIRNQAGAAGLDVNDSGLEFVQASSATAESRTVVLTGVGPNTVSISNVAITGPDAAEFSITQAAPNSLAPGQSAGVIVELRPVEDRLHRATLEISANINGGQMTVDLFGGATNAGPSDAWTHEGGDAAQSGQSHFAAPLEMPALVWQVCVADDPEWEALKPVVSPGELIHFNSFETVFEGPISRTGRYTAVDASGQVDWRLNTHNLGSATAKDGTVYVNGITPMALRPDGKLRWADFLLSGSTVYGPVTAPTGKTYFVTRSSGVTYIRALDESGQFEWLTSTAGNPGQDQLWTPALLPNGTLAYVTTTSVGLIDTNTGLTVWLRDGLVPLSIAAGPDNSIYVQTETGLVALNASDGTTRWTNSEAIGPPAVAAEGFIATSNAIVNADGSTRFIGLNHTVRDRPTITSDNKIIAAEFTGVIHQYDANGSLEWTVELERAIDSSPVLTSNGTLVIATRGCLVSYSDGSGNTGNTAPVAANDAATVDEDFSVDISVLANDTDADGEFLTIASATDPANGQVEIVGSTIRYTPAANFFGTDSFTYIATDGVAQSGAATVTVTVSPINDAPIAVADSLFAGRNTSVLFNVTENDLDVDGDVLSVVSATKPTAGGTLVLESGQLRYTPLTDFSGTDTFEYTVSDPSGSTASASVIVEVGTVSFALTQLGSFPASVATALNDENVVVGAARNADGKLVPWKFANGVATELSIPGLADAAAWDINNSGVIVGSGRAADSTGVAFIINAGGSTSILEGLGGGLDIAYSVTNSGSVYGLSKSEDGSLRAVRFLPTLAEIYADASQSSEVFAANDQGLVAGVSYRADGTPSPIVGDPSNPLATIGMGRAIAINAAGVAVGMSETIASTHAVRWEADGSATPLFGTAGYSEALGINDAGWVVGIRGIGIIGKGADGQSSNDLLMDTHPQTSKAVRRGDLVALQSILGFQSSVETQFGASGFGAGAVSGGTDSVFAKDESGQTTNSAIVTEAVLYSQGTARRLSDVTSADGWLLAEATAINNGSAIVGYGFTTGVAQAFFLQATSNTSPIARPDRVFVAEGGIVDIDAIENDDDLESDLHIVSFSSPVSGSVSLNPDRRTLRYVSNAADGLDSFTYTVADDFGASATSTVEILVGIAKTDDMFLSGAYPNPFESGASLSYFLPTDSEVVIELFDTLGRRIQLLANGYQQAGTRTLHVEGTELAAGRYFVRMATGGRTRTTVLMKR